MPDPNPSTVETVTPKTITEIEPARPSEVTLKRSYIVAACSAGLVICFFLPWMHILWGAPSGFDFAKTGGNTVLLWSMPILAAIAAIAGISGKNYQIAGQLAACVPFAILFYSLNDAGRDLLKTLAIGAWLAIGLSVILLAVARK